MDARRNVLALLLLVVAFAGVQAWLILRAVTPAQDAVRFIAMAQAIHRDGMLATLAADPSEPLFAVVISGVHGLLSHVAGSRPTTWVQSAQWAAAVPLVLSVLAVYLLHASLLGRRAALAAAILFCALLEVARLGADGIADSTHLLFLILALWCVVNLVRVAVRAEPGGQRRVHRHGHDLGSHSSQPEGTAGQASSGTRNPDIDSALAPLAWGGFFGTFLALAVLTKSEAWILVPPCLLVMIVIQRRPAWRLSGLRMAAGGMSILLGVAVVLVPFLYALEIAKPAAVANVLLGQQRRVPWESLNVSVADRGPAAGEMVKFTTPHPAAGGRFGQWWAAPQKAIGALAESLGYVVGLFAVLGVYWRRRRRWRPESLLLAVFCVCYLAAAVWYGARVGYFSSRHVLPIVAVAVGWGGYGVLEAGRRVARWRGGAGLWKRRLAVRPLTPDPILSRRNIAQAASLCRDERAGSLLYAVCPLTPSPSPARGEGGCFLSWSLVAAVALLLLPRTFAPLHANRVGHRRAGEWLADVAPQAGSVLDTRGWTGLFSGRATYRERELGAALNDPDLAYVVIERRELVDDSPRAATLAELLQTSTTPVAEFDQPTPGPDKTVVIYQWRPAQRIAASGDITDDPTGSTAPLQ